MYERYKQRNFFPLSNSEMNLNDYGLSKIVIPEIMHLSSKLEEYHFKPLFTPDQLFPKPFEDLSYPKDYKDLIFDNAQSEEKTSDALKSEAVKLSKLVKSNRHLLKRIETTLTFVQSLSGEQLLQQSSGSIKLSLRQGAVFSMKGSGKRMTNKELRSKLENESVCLLNLLKNWTACSANHKNVIDSMERYRKLVNKYVRRNYHKEYPINQLHNLLLEGKNAQIEGPNFLFQSQSVKNNRKHTKRAIKSNHKYICTQLGLSFLGINQDAKRSLRNLESPFIRNKGNFQFLNMSSINKLLAIAKMLQYCLDNGITVAEFMEDRTYQKIKARLERMKEVAIVDPLGVIKDVVHCPSLDEMPFLLSLKSADIGSVADVLKNNVASLPYTKTPLNSEEELKRVEGRNKSIIEKTGEVSVLQTKMNHDICRVKRRRKKGNKDNKIKKQKIEDLGSDTNTTPKECSIKRIIQLPITVDKPKFKVLRVDQESERKLKLKV